MALDRVPSYLIKGDVAFSPIQALLDPVSKLRVSTPENLIDTDFEYGLQTTKWETLELVNNIPTFFNRAGDDPIAFNTITGTNGTDVILVNCLAAHNLTVGSPIIVQGLRSTSAEGAYVVTRVVDANNFEYKAKRTQTVTQQLHDTYTLVFPGQLYQGTQYRLDALGAIHTNGANPSTITVDTTDPHGFAVGTKFLLTNSVSNKVLSFSGQGIDIASDIASTKVTVANNLVSGATGYQEFNTIPYDWQGTQSLFFKISNIDLNLNKFTFLTVHGLANNDQVMYVSPIGDNVVGGLVNYAMYYVKKLTDYEFQLTTTFNGSAIDLTTNPSITFGPHAFFRAYKVQQVDSVTNDTLILENAPVFTTGAEMFCFTSNSATGGVAATTTGGIANISLSVNNFNPVNYDKHIADQVDAPNRRLRLTSPSGAVRDIINTNVNGFTWLVPSVDITERDSIYVQNHGFVNNDILLLTSAQTPPGGLSNGSIYFTERVSNDRFRVKGTKAGSTIQLSSVGTATLNWALRKPNANVDTVFSTAHGVTDGTQLVYNNAGNPSIGGLTNSTTYYAYKSDANRFKLTTQASNPIINSYTFVQNTSNINLTYAYVELGQTHNWTTGDAVEYKSLFEVDGIIDSSIYYVRVWTSSQFSLYYTKADALAGSSRDVALGTDQRVRFTGSPTGDGTFRKVDFVDLTSQAAGTHTFNVIKEGGADDVYEVASVPTINTFTLASSSQLDKRSFNFNPSDSVDLYRDAIYLPGHKLYTGAPIDYTVGGSGTAIGGLVNTTRYYVIRVSRDWIELAETPDLAKAKIAINLNSIGTGSSHNFLSPSVAGEVFGNGTVGITVGSNLVTGTNTNFLNLFKIGDIFKVNINQDNPTITVAQSGTTVNTTTSVITFNSHGFVNGEAVRYNSAGPIGGLTDNNIYYVRVTDANNFSLHESPDGANNNNLRLILTTVGSGNGTFNKFNNGCTFESRITAIRDKTRLVVADNVPSVIFNKPLGKSAVITNKVLSTNNATLTTLVNHNFVNGDQVVVTGVDSTFNGTYTITGVTGNTFTYTKVSGNVPSASVIPNGFAAQNANTVSTLNYVQTTALFVKADGFAIHRPYDGGVELIPATNPDAQIIRQTRKYFRYQSGKGIQVSFAINFSAPTEITTLTRNSGSNIAIVKTVNPHRMSSGVKIKVENAVVSGGTNYWNGNFTVDTVIDDYQFTYNMLAEPVGTKAQGFPQFAVREWQNSRLRCGLFDDQNGMFFEYDGQYLYCVRRSSVQQLSGRVQTTFNSAKISGTDTSFTSQIAAGQMIVIKGQSYKVVGVDNDTTMYIQPVYRGQSSTNVVVTKTIDTRTTQSLWSIDKCDGTGVTGYNLDINKIQMAYMDYSWYGAGKIRYGFKDQLGEVKYVHEFKHNNIFTEAYFRSGNLPARYEVINTGTPNYVPSLNHWGTSVIMDGEFQQDDAYLFTAAGNIITNTNATTATFTAQIAATTQRATRYDPTQGRSVPVWRIEATTYSAVRNIPSGTPLVNATYLQAGTKTVGSVQQSGSVGFIYIDRAPIQAIGTNQTFTYGDSTELPALIPLVSIRLAPSVDNGTTGVLGSREIINRMQLILNSVGILTNYDAEIKLLLNGILDNSDWQRVTSPSLSQVVYHASGNTITGGTQIYNFRAPGGSPETVGSLSRRVSNATTFNLNELVNMGNSILGGDGVYPDGPDVLTIAATVVDLIGVGADNPISITGRLSWSESQA